MTGQHWSIRKTARRQEQVARLGRATGLGEDFSAVVDYALSYAIGRQEAREMARMSTAAERGEALYEAATNASVAESLESYGSAEAVAQAVVELLGHGDVEDVVAYIEHAH